MRNGEADCYLNGLAGDEADEAVATVTLTTERALLISLTATSLEVVRGGDAVEAVTAVLIVLEGTEPDRLREAVIEFFLSFSFRGALIRSTSSGVIRYEIIRHPIFEAINIQNANPVNFSGIHCENTMPVIIGPIPRDKLATDCAEP